VTALNDCDTPLQAALISAEAAREQLIAAAVAVRQTESVPLVDALNRVLAGPVKSSMNVPPASNSSMDGYAVRSGDTAEMNEMPVSQRIPAGTAGTTLQTGTAARIFTGAPIPDGADAVVMQEDVETTQAGIRFAGPVKAGTNVRMAGEDIHAGSTILDAGKLLRPQELGLAASIGVGELQVYRKLKVAILVTGDELVSPGEPLAAGQIYDANRYTLGGLLQQLNCEVVSLPVVRDDPGATRGALLKASAEADLIVSSGGVSVGEEDYVRLALQELGKLEMWRIAIKPGKPLAYGEINRVPFIGLPGNPVSVFVTFCWLVAPFIKLMQGQSWVPPVPIRVKAAFEWPVAGIRREYVRARMELEGDLPVVSIYPNQGSGVLSSACWANGLVEIPEHETVHPGDHVKFWYFETLL
jgi:molybdopterin molybdotransferase